MTRSATWVPAIRHGLSASLLLLALLAMGSTKADGDDPALDAGLTALAQEVLRAAPAIDGQDKASVRLQAHYDAHAKVVHVDYVAGYLPANEVEMARQQAPIRRRIIGALEPARPVRGIRFLYAGKPLSHYVPAAYPGASR